MKYEKLYQRGLTLAVCGVLGGLFSTPAQADTVNQSAANPTSYRYTRYDMEQMLKHKQQAKYQMPIPKHSTIRDLNATDTFTPGHHGEPLDVWDSWPIKDAKGNVATIKGYHIVMALVGNPNHQIKHKENGKIGIFYQKANQWKHGAKSWHYAGVLFNSAMEGSNNPDDDVLQHETGEWSGSAMVQSNGYIRLMYTSFSGSSQYGGFNDNRQTLMTAQVKLNVSKHKVSVNHKAATGKHAVFAGDDHYYEDVEHSTDVTGFTADDHTLRDPQIFMDHGHTYVLFEGNTAAASGPIGTKSLNYLPYYGGSRKFQVQQQALIKRNPNVTVYGGKLQPLQTAAADANGCLGLIELNRDYQVSRVLPPLVTFNLVDDETERPSIVRANHRWYIFTAMHGWHMASPHAGATDSFMLGFSSSQLTKGYTPLNKYGLVMHTNQSIKSRTFTYSYSMNQQRQQPYLLTSYMTQLNTPQAHGHSTFAPSIAVYLTPRTTKLQKHSLPQGAVSF